MKDRVERSSGWRPSWLKSSSKIKPTDPLRLSKQVVERKRNWSDCRNPTTGQSNKKYMRIKSLHNRPEVITAKDMKMMRSGRPAYNLLHCKIVGLVVFFMTSSGLGDPSEYHSEIFVYFFILFILLWIKKTRVKDKTYIWGSVWWKTKKLKLRNLHSSHARGCVIPSVIYTLSVSICCLLWTVKASAKDKKYTWISVRWKAKN